MADLRIRTLVQSTDEVEPKRAFEFWRDTALAMTGVVSSGMGQPRSFTASRLVAVTPHSTLLHTQSDKIDIARSAQHIRRDGRDDVTIALFTRGTGYFEQGHRGAKMVPGDISIVETNRPFLAGGYEAYEEIRLITARSTFRTHVGEPTAFAGRTFGKGRLSALFTTYLQTYAGLAPTMSGAEAEIAVEGVLHLLRSFANASEGEVSFDALKSLASVHIERCLHDPTFGPEALHKALSVSRSRLYAAFADGEGVAAAIRDARLDRVNRHLSMAAHANESIAAIIGRCGFTNVSSFSAAFRRRFGMSARDLRGARGGAGSIDRSLPASSEIEA